MIERYHRQLDRLQGWSNALLNVGGLWSIFDSQEPVQRHAAQLVELDVFDLSN